jgi:hypothetical protein
VLHGDLPEGVTTPSRTGRTGRTGEFGKPLNIISPLLIPPLSFLSFQFNFIEKRVYSLYGEEKMTNLRWRRPGTDPLAVSPSPGMRSLADAASSAQSRGALSRKTFWSMRMRRQFSCECLGDTPEARGAERRCGTHSSDHGLRCASRPGSLDTNGVEQGRLYGACPRLCNSSGESVVHLG